MRLVSWKPLARNSLRGFVSIELPSGLRIADCHRFGNAIVELVLQAHPTALVEGPT
jgi:hypothetical protein